MWELQDTPIFTYDTETNGKFDRFELSLVGMSFAYGDPEDPYSYYVPLAHDEGKQIDFDKAINLIKGPLTDPSIEKICHNVKFDEMVMYQYGIDVQGPGNCTYIMAWMLAEDLLSKGQKPLEKRYLGVERDTYEDVIAMTRKEKNVPRDYSFARVQLEEARVYGGGDSYYDFKLFHLFKKMLEEQNLWTPYTRIERPFTRLLRRLEQRGVYIDQTYIAQAEEQLPKIIEQVEAAIYEEAGEVFNIGSGKQLGHILYEKLGIGKNVPKTKTGNYATDKKTLTNYATQHRIVENILRRKKIQKTHSTFVEGTRGFIGKDGRVHPSFNGSGTVTGRLSCSSPNLQQIEGDEVEAIKVRNFFVPSPGYRFVVADYGQIELRLMAHFSKDKNMIEAFLSGRDFHEETARKMFNLGPDEEVVHRQRFGAKAINFGIGYGRGPMSIAEQIGCSLTEAKEFISYWEKSFPNVIAYKNHVLQQARQTGYVRTLSGRKRRLPDIQSNDWSLRGRAERQAFNTKIQGSAADLIKLAMLSLEPKLVPYDAHMVLQIHDEIVIETPISCDEEIMGITEKTMENPHNDKNPLILPLTVDAKIVDRWGDAK